jgi:hypothetical protein
MMRETLQSYLFYVFAESIVTVSDEKAKTFALEAASDGLFEIPINVDWSQEILNARNAANDWIKNNV